MTNPLQKSAILLLSVLMLLSATLYASANGKGRPQGPPPEAIAACEGKSAGDSVQFTDPRGGSHEGTCREVAGQLVAVPDTMPERGGRQ